MPTKLPPLIQRYIDASNAHDLKPSLQCFADDAVVGDENATTAARATSSIGSRQQSRDTNFN
jgi:hypothetical protein